MEPAKIKVDLLAPIRDLLSTPERWTQGHYALVADGAYAVGVRDPQAACWCLDGAILACYHGPGNTQPRTRVTREVERRIDMEPSPRRQTIPGYNDAKGRTFEDIQALLAEPLWHEVEAVA